MDLHFTPREGVSGRPFFILKSHPAVFERFESGGFHNLRGVDGQVSPLFRIEKKSSEIRQSIDGVFGEDLEPFSTRRRTRTNPPLLDLFMELDRLIHFPDLPSRTHSRMANLRGFQREYWEAGKRLCLVLPHESSVVAIAGIEDFRACSARQTVGEILAQLKWAEPAELLSHADAFVKLFTSDNTSDHDSLAAAFSARDIIIDLVSLVGSARRQFQHSKTTFPSSQFSELLEYWSKCTLLKQSDAVRNSDLNEVLIQGKCRVVELEEFAID